MGAMECSRRVAALQALSENCVRPQKGPSWASFFHFKYCSRSWLTPNLVFAVFYHNPHKARWAPASRAMCHPGLWTLLLCSASVSPQV